jgi:hypothetical protein
MPVDPKLDHVDLLYPSKYLKAGDLMGREVVVEISDVMPNQELRLPGGAVKVQHLLVFKGKKKQMVMNKTNAKAIAGLYGNRPSGWIGRRVILREEQVDYKGSRVPGLRVKKQLPPGEKSRTIDLPQPPGEADLEWGDGSSGSPPHDPETGEVKQDWDDVGPPAMDDGESF